MKWSPSGWMGCGELGEKHVNFTRNWRTNSHTEPTSIKVVYKPCSKGWAGIYWLNRPDDWKTGADLTGYTKLTLWARGETGTEMVEFKFGTEKDSGTGTTGDVSLTREWKPYAIPLTGVDLSRIAGGFAWVASNKNNPSGLTFYVDDVVYE
jgi:hypothetical protein